MPINKKQLEEELAFAKKMWESYKEEIKDVLAGKKEKNCMLSMLEFSAEIRVRTLQELLDKYFVPREYLKCNHCKSRVLLTPDIDPEGWMCPKRHFNFTSTPESRENIKKARSGNANEA